MRNRLIQNVVVLAGLALGPGCWAMPEDPEAGPGEPAELEAEALPVGWELRGQVPMIEVNGKKQKVSRREFIAHQLKSAKGKYALIAVPDG